MKKCIILMLTLVMLVGLVGCAQSPDESTNDADANVSSEATATNESTTVSDETTGKTKISILRPGDEEKVAAFMEPAIEQFMIDNPDIEVEIVYESWGGWIQKYPTLFESDTQPDVIFWWDNKQNDASVRDKLVALTDYLDEDLIAKIPESVWALASIDEEEIYYVPSTTDVFVLIYNKDVFKAAGLDPEAPPTTWDELLAACEAIDANTDVPAMGVPAKTGMETLQEFVTNIVVAKTGQDMIDENNEVTFNTAEGLEALDYIDELFQYAQPSATEYGRGDLRPMLRDGELGMIIDSAWTVPTFQDAYGENLDDSPIGFAAIPVVSEGAEKVCWMGTNGWVATRDKNAEASAKLINYLMTDEVLFAHHKAYGSIPMFEYELEQDFYKYDFWKTYRDAANSYEVYGMLAKYSPTPAAYYAEFEEVWQLFLIGQLDAQGALDAAVAKAQEINARQE